jgi:hypothetical protein
MNKYVCTVRISTNVPGGNEVVLHVEGEGSFPFIKSENTEHEIALTERQQLQLKRDGYDVTYEPPSPVVPDHDDQFDPKEGE